MTEMSRRTVKLNGPDPVDKYVGSRIRARRVGLRMSQTKLGDAIDVTFQQIQKYENGTNRVGASNLYKIAQALGVDVSFFYQGMPEYANGGNGSGHSMAPGVSERDQRAFAEDPLTSREAIELMHNYYRVRDSAVRRRLFQFVKSLAASTHLS
jgi:transcriptional regulator with XRE-family HTH domain